LKMIGIMLVMARLSADIALSSHLICEVLKYVHV
jgi:hypothetical protein